MPLLDFLTSCADAVWEKTSKKTAKQSCFSIVFIMRVAWRNVDVEQ
jgi:hypothetical protein